MHIVDRETFLALPSGTLFQKYEPCVFEELCVKGETVGPDFWLFGLGDAWLEGAGDSSRLFEMYAEMETGVNHAIEVGAMRRDGLFDGGQLFAVWRSADCAALVRYLTAVLAVD